METSHVRTWLVEVGFEAEIVSSESELKMEWYGAIPPMPTTS